jgi:hypothetical protein
VGGAPADWAAVSPRWPQLIAVSRALHAELAGLAGPEWRGTAENPWTIGDQVAWGERDPEPLLERAPRQLAGQVRRLPAPLDRRPAGLPLAVVAVDALQWRRAGPNCSTISLTSRNSTNCWPAP